MIKYVLLVFCFLLSTLNFYAQDDKDDEMSTKSGWHYIADVYMLFPSMVGNTQIGNLPSVEVDASTGDIFSNLKFGAMLYFEARNDNWAISSDFVYMKLGQDLKSNALINSGDIVVKQTIWELAGLRRVMPWLEVGAGLRLVSLKMDLNFLTNIMATPPRSASISETWVDPILIVRSQNIVDEKWLFNFRGDLGGFGLGSDFTWQIQADVGYTFSDLFYSTIGYRYIGIDYNTGNGASTFVYDVDTSGPVIRLGFKF